MKSSGVKDILISVVSFSLMTLGVKALTNIPAYEIVFFRTLISLILCFYSLKRAKIPAFGFNRPVLLLRGVAGTSALLMYFYTLQTIPLASAVTLQYLSPIFTVIVSWLWLRERITIVQAVAFIVSFSGATLIKGFDSRVSVELLLLAIVAAAISGFAYTCVRRLKDEHPLVVVFYFPLVAVPTVGIYTLMNWVTPTLYELAILVYIGVTTQIAQLYMTKAYHQAPVAQIAVFKYLGAIFAVLFGYFLFKESIPTGALIGIGLVLFGVMGSHFVVKKPKVQSSK